MPEYLEHSIFCGEPGGIVFSRIGMICGNITLCFGKGCGSVGTRKQVISGLT